MSTNKDVKLYEQNGKKISRKEDSKKDKHDRRKDVKKESKKKIVRKVEELQRENILLKESKKQERHIYKDEEDYL